MPQWRFQIINMFRQEFKNGNLQLPTTLDHLANYQDFNNWLNILYKKTWVVNFSKKTDNKKINIDYLGKYLKRPPIGETRIKEYDENTITFEYLDHYTNSKTTRTMSIYDFIMRLITHIHDTGFRCIRYYGFLANRLRGKLLPIVHKLLKNPSFNSLYQKIKISWQQLILQSFGIDPLKCKICNQTMMLHSITFPPKNFSFLFTHQQIITQKN